MDMTERHDVTMKQTGAVLKGTMILSGAALLVKLLGAFYRIYLSRLIGAEGIGLYQMAYPIYLIFLALSTAGIPIAISKMVAEKVTRADWKGIAMLLKAAFALLLVLGVTCCLGMIFSASWVATHLLADSRAVYSIWALAPGIFLMSLSAVFRGYFQGRQNMQPSATSQILEQLVRIGVALALALLLLGRGVEHAAAGAAFGASFGGAAALGYLGLFHWRHRSRSLFPKTIVSASEIKRMMRELVRFALPISAAVILTPLLQGLDSIVVPKRLQSIGYVTAQSTAMLGLLGNAWAVVHLPLIVTTAMATNLVPAIAALVSQGRDQELKHKVTEGLRLALLYLTPVVVVTVLFGTFMYQLIYGMTGISLLAWYAPVILFLGLEQVSAGIIQALGKPQWPLYSFVMGSLIKMAVTVTVIGWPGFNLTGAAVGTVCGAGVTAMLNLGKIRKLMDLKTDFVLPQIMAGLVMYCSCAYWRQYWQAGAVLEFCVISAGGCLLYLVLLWYLGGITVEDREVVRRFLNLLMTARWQRLS
jgi:stage V sporulation protein B